MDAKLDTHLHEALAALPTFPFMRLVRPDRVGLRAARAALAAGQVPTFTFAKAQAFPLAAYQAALTLFRNRIDELAPNKTIATLYRAKVHELTARASLIAHLQRSDSTGASACARTLYGDPAATRTELEAHLTEIITNAGPRKTPSQVMYWINAEMFAEMARRMFAYYGMADARVSIRQRKHLKVSHHRATHAMRLAVPASLHITRRRARQLLAHEIEGHALRHLNGVHSPLHLLARGTARYLLADEGIAMTLQEEYAQGNHWPGFWESYAVALALEHNGPTTFAKLRDARTALAHAMQDADAQKTGEDAAWRLCLRIYRGIARPDAPGLVFPRDHVYLSGYRTVSALPSVNPLYVGHASIADVPALTALGITPHHTPDRISKKIVSDVVRSVIAANRPS